LKGQILPDGLNFPLQAGFEESVWLFEFAFESTITEKMLQEAIINYFDNISNILLPSEVYVLTSIDNDTYQVFEVYRRSPTLKMTVIMVCQIANNKTEYLNKNPIWTRRKDLSGIHFQIGCIKNNKLVFKDNEVEIQYINHLSLFQSNFSQPKQGPML